MNENATKAYQWEPMNRTELEYWAEGRPGGVRVDVAKTALYWMDRAEACEDEE